MPEGHPPYLTSDLSPDEALAFTLEWLASTPDDDELCLGAVFIGEPLIDWHWEAIEERFVGLLEERADLRKMVSCCAFDEAVPQRVRDRIYELIGPDDDLG